MAKTILLPGDEGSTRILRLTKKLAAAFEKEGISRFCFAFRDPDSDESSYLTGYDPADAIDMAVKIIESARDLQDEEEGETGLDKDPVTA